MSRSARSIAGFTLIEMMVVISIITLLISISLPSLRSSRHSANSAKCGSNQRQLAVAITNYADEHRHYPVGLDVHNDNSQRVWLWPTQARWYTGNEQGVFHCPQAPAETQWIKKQAPGEPAFYGYEKDEMRILGSTHKFSYGYNVWGAFMLKNPNTGLGIYRNHPYGDATPIYRVRSPQNMIAFADSNINDFWSGFIGPYRTGQWPSRIHFGSANVAFVDTHVLLMAREDLVDVADHEVNRRWNTDYSFHAGSVVDDNVPSYPY